MNNLIDTTHRHTFHRNDVLDWGGWLATGNFPFVTTFITICSLICFYFLQSYPLTFAPGGVDMLWQCLTCHLVHWNTEHLFWSLGTFAVLGCLCEHTIPMAFYRALAVSAFTIPAAMLFLSGADAFPYGGISGVDSALFALP